MLALLILVKPGIQVKLVINTAPPQLECRDIQLGEQRYPDPEVGRCLFLGQTPSCGQRQAVVIHVTYRPIPCGKPWPVLPAPWLSALLPARDR